MSLQPQSCNIGRQTLIQSALIASLCTLLLTSSASALQYRTNHAVSDIAVGDMNGDGIDDIVTCGTANDRSSINVLLGNGDGTFQRAKTSAVSRGPAALVLGDFNLDGNLDVATANFGIEDVFNKTISVLLGNGDGTIQNRQDINVGNRPRSIAAADMNGDGILDLVVVTASQFVVLLGDGVGFETSQSTDLFSTSEGIALGDVDNDGNTDVLIGDNSHERVALSLGNGDGSFRPPTVLLVTSARNPMLTDVDGDGLPDLVGISPDQQAWAVYLNVGHGRVRFVFQEITYFLNDTVEDFAAGDFNADGITDFALTADDPEKENDVVYTKLGYGNGTFTQVSNEIGVGDVIAIGSFNSDFTPDLATGSNLSVITAYGRGDGVFGNQP